MSFKIVEPVVVYPDTLSNQAFTRVNSPPQSTYGSIPKTKDRSQARMMVRKPSLSESSGAFLTNMNGKAPTIVVIIRLIRRGVNAESYSSAIEMSRDTNIKKALTSRAFPTLIDMAFTLIIRYPFLP